MKLNSIVVICSLKYKYGNIRRKKKKKIVSNYNIGHDPTTFSIVMWMIDVGIYVWTPMANSIVLYQDKAPNISIVMNIFIKIKLQIYFIRLISFNFYIVEIG